MTIRRLDEQEIFLEHRRGVGVILTAIGLVLLAIPYYFGIEETGGRIVLFIAGGFLVLAGLLTSLYKAELRMSIPSRRYHREWGMFKKKVQEGTFDDFKQLRLVSEVRRTKDSTYTVYLAKLTILAEELDLMSSQDEGKTRDKFMEFGRLLGVKMFDETGGGRKELNPEVDSLTLKERARLKGSAAASPPPPPKGCTIGIQVEGADLHLLLPRTGKKGAGCILIPFGLIWTVFSAVMMFFAATSAEGWEQIGVIAFVGLFVLIGLGLLGGGFYSVFSVSHVVVSPQRLLFYSTWLGREWGRTELDAAKIEEVGIHSEQNKKEIFVRADEKMTTFGSHLQHGEMEWLKSVVEGVLGS